MSTDATPQAIDAAGAATAPLDGSIAAVTNPPIGLPMDLDAIENLFAGTGSVSVPATALEGAPTEGDNAPVVAPAAPVQAPTPDAAAAADTTTDQPDTDGHRPNRIGTNQFNDREWEALELKHQLKQQGIEIDIFEAGKRVEAKYAQPSATTTDPNQTQQTQPSALETLNSKLSDAQANLDALRQQRTELTEGGGKFYDEEVAELTRQIEEATLEVADLRGEVRLTQREHDQQQQQRQLTAEQQAVAKRDESRQRAVQQFPSAADGKSPLGQRIKQMVAERQKETHPDHAMLYAETAAEVFTEKAAIELARENAAAKGTSFAAEFEALMAPATATAATTVADPVVPERRVLPSPGNRATPPPPPNRTETDILKEAGTDPDKLDALFNANQPMYFLRG